MNGYTDAIETLMTKSTLMGFFLVLIALLVLFIGVGTAVKLWRDLRKPKDEEGDTIEKHIQDSEDRFLRGEKSIETNRQDIADLKEGLRVTCVANMALLNHAIHNGNTNEMIEASQGLNTYLINRK